MAKDPAYPMYAQDFDMDTADWNIEEVGIYIRLLNYEWINGYIPNDIRRIAKIARVSPRKLQKSWEIISKKFSQTVDNKLQNKRMEREREKRLNYLKHQQESGRKGAKIRWGKDSDPNGDPIGKPNGESMALHTHSLSLKEKEQDICAFQEKAVVCYATKRKRKLAGVKLEKFNLFWEAFKLPKGKADAGDAWLDISDFDETLFKKIIKAAKLEAINRNSDKPKWAQGWLNSKRWEDEIREATGDDNIYDRHIAANEAADKMVQ